MSYLEYFIKESIFPIMYKCKMSYKEVLTLSVKERKALIECISDLGAELDDLE